MYERDLEVQPIAIDLAETLFEPLTDQELEAVGGGAFPFIQT